MRKRVFVAKATPEYIYGLIMLLALALYYLTVCFFAENIPLSDDFPAVLGFLGSFYSHESGYKLNLLSAQLNEHRIVLNRLVSLAVYKINGVVDFKLLIIVGNIMLLPAIYGFYTSFKQSYKKIKYFLPAVLILTVPQFTGAIFWATSAVQNISCLAFSMLALARLNKDDIFSSMASFAFAVFAVFSAGNGLFLFPSVIIVLLLAKKKKAAVFWTIGAVVILLAYFYGYNTPVHNKLYYAANVRSIIEYFFVFVGSPAVFNVSWMKNLIGDNAEPIIRIISAVTGGLIVAYYIFLAKIRYYKKNPAIFSMFIFFFITALFAAIARSGAGPMQAFASRYRIIPVSILALVYLSYMETRKVKIADVYYKHLTWLALLFLAVSYIANLPGIKSNRDNLVQSITSWQKDGTGLQRLHDDPVYADRQLRDSIEKKIYFPEK